MDFFIQENDDVEEALVQLDDKSTVRKNKTETGNRSVLPSCPECSAWDPNVLVIKPSMMWFAQMHSIS